jgi:ATP-dependent metalloprotease
MVTRMGFSELLGDVDLDNNYNRLSPDTRQKIDQEVRRIVDESRQRATKLLSSKKTELEFLANALVEYEVLNLEEMKKVIKGEKLPKLTLPEKTPVKLPELPSLPPSIGGGDGPNGISSPGGTEDKGARI